MTPKQKRIIQRSRAARQGRRHYAFYQGFHAFSKGVTKNPYAPGSEIASCWAAGWKYARGQP